MNNSSLMEMREVAKLLNIGHRKLFRILREERVLTRQNNLPKHSLVELGLFQVERRSFRKGGDDYSAGIETPYTVTLVTPQGITFINDIIEQRTQNKVANG